MSTLADVGNLMYLYLDEIEPGEGVIVSEFLVKASANLLNEYGGRNWIPLIVRRVGKSQYEVIGNSFIYAVAEAAGLERVWCIIADETDGAVEISKVLARETIPKVNLSTASRDEIVAALNYLIEQPGSPIKAVKPAIAANRIEESPRQYWKTLDPITTLKCGITKGKKLDALKQVFYLAPQPLPDVIQEPTILATLTVAELKKMAKKREINVPSKAKKQDLVELLS
jgi:HeH/LEM domain